VYAESSRERHEASPEVGRHPEVGLFELLADAQAIKHNGMPADLATIPFRIWDAAWMTGPSGRNRSTPAATSSPF
jgi:hypothetical protein